MVKPTTAMTLLFLVLCHGTLLAGSHYLYENMTIVRNDPVMIGGRDTVTIRACTLTVNRDIMVMQGGVLNLEGDTVILNCNLYAWDSARIRFDRCRILWRTEYIYQYGITLAGHAALRMDSTRLTIPVSAGMTVTNDASFDVAACRFAGTWTKIAEQRARMTLTDCEHAFEFMVKDSAVVHFKRCSEVLTWLHFQNGVKGEIAMPGDTGWRFLDSFYLGPRSSSIRGITYEVRMDSTTNMWGCIPEQGCSLTVRDSRLRVMGFILSDSSAPYRLRKIENRTRFVSQQLAFPDRSVTLANTYVMTFNLYTMLGAELYLDTSTVGEIISYHHSKVRLKGVTVDGSGGFYGLEGVSEVLADDCRFTCQVKVEDSARLRMNSCVAYGMTAVGGGRVLAQNSWLPPAPDIRDSARLLSVSLAEPASLDTLKALQPVSVDIINRCGPLGDTFNLSGSAWHVALGDSSAGVLAGARPLSGGRNRICEWNTQGVTPGIVLVVVPVEWGEGDTLSAMAAAWKATAAEAAGPAVSMISGWGVSPNPFSSSLSIRLPGGAAAPAAASSVMVLDPWGRVVRHLAAASDDRAILIWDGRDDLGRAVAQGWYVLKVESAGSRFQAPVMKVR